MKYHIYIPFELLPNEKFVLDCSLSKVSIEAHVMCASPHRKAHKCSYTSQAKREEKRWKLENNPPFKACKGQMDIRPLSVTFTIPLSSLAHTNPNHC